MGIAEDSAQREDPLALHPRMAMKYQMASEARDEAIAEAMSKLAKTS